MTRTIQKLQEQMADKEGYMALAHTRLGNRAQRTGMELCRDHAETSLVAEVTELRNNIKQVQLMLNEVGATLECSTFVLQVVIFVGSSVPQVSAEDTDHVGARHQREDEHVEDRRSRVHGVASNARVPKLLS